MTNLDFETPGILICTLLRNIADATTDENFWVRVAEYDTSGEFVKSLVKLREICTLAGYDVLKGEAVG